MTFNFLKIKIPLPLPLIRFGKKKTTPSHCHHSMASEPWNASS